MAKHDKVVRPKGLKQSGKKHAKHTTGKTRIITHKGKKVFG